MSDITETMTVKNGQAAVKTVTVAGKLSPKTSATDTIALVETSDGKQAALKVYNINGEGGGGTGGDYLPLSGGTLTGPLTITAEKTDYSFVKGKFLKIIKESEDGSKKELTIYATSSGIALDGLDLNGVSKVVPVGDRLGSLGQSFSRWNSVYTTIINNGADLIVPTEGGTLARLEDIQNAGGLPDQTDNAGKFLTTDGTTASWSNLFSGNYYVNGGAILYNERTKSKIIEISEFGTLTLGNKTQSVSIQGNLEPTYDAISDGYAVLGSASKPWQYLYLKYISGNDYNSRIMVPTEGGTMARIEDINAAVGDISTALTAILGE